MGVIWHAWCLYFNILGRSWDDPVTLGSAKKDVVRSRLGFYRFLVDLVVEPFRKIFGYIWSEKRICFASISRLSFLMFLGPESGCLGLEKHAFGKGGIAKSSFHRNWISLDSSVHFSWFWMSLGPIFMIFVALETGMKFDEFSRWFWGQPRSWDPPCGMVPGH